MLVGHYGRMFGLIPVSVSRQGCGMAHSSR